MHLQDVARRCLLVTNKQAPVPQICPYDAQKQSRATCHLFMVIGENASAFLSL